MHWETVYLTCFGVGLVFSIISLLGGLSHLHIGHFHFGGHAHVHTPHGAHAHSANSISPINGFTITAFLCWFGGTGYLLYHYHLFFAPFIVLLATASGVAGAGMIFLFLAKILLPHEHAMTAEETEIIGTIGRVSVPVRSGGTGEILYSQAGTRRSAAARSDDGSPLGKDIEIIVMRYENGVAYVRPWEVVAGEFDASLRSISQSGNSS